jgi:hypothetical protein
MGSEVGGQQVYRVSGERWAVGRRAWRLQTAATDKARAPLLEQDVPVTMGGGGAGEKWGINTKNHVCPIL